MITLKTFDARLVPFNLKPTELFLVDRFAYASETSVVNDLHALIHQIVNCFEVVEHGAFPSTQTSLSFAVNVGRHQAVCG
jgi:hypothetical protein